MDEYIHIKGARVNNLKNVDVRIPRGKFVVITGLSGSGKSSLAFDTIYAEGQRLYVESLSAYARQFLGRMQKPDCDFIHGLPPAIAIEQKTTSRNPRSTVGTSTEVYDYLRMLFARAGHTVSPVSGMEVKRNTVEDVVQCMLSYASGTRFTVLAPMMIVEGRSMEHQLEIEMMQGITRVEVNDAIVPIADFLGWPESKRKAAPTPMLLIDRLTVSDSPDNIARLSDSVETAFYESNGTCLLRFYPAGITHTFSMRFEADGITFREPDDDMFAFNSPLGACPKCEGFGRVLGIDETLVVPDRSLSVYDGAVMCWRGEKMGLWKEEFCRRASKKGFPIFEPYYKLTRQQIDTLWYGDENEKQRDKHDRVTIEAFFKMLEENQYKIQNRVMLARYRGKTVCPECRGTRLRKEASYVKIAGHSITELVDMPLIELARFFDNLTLSEHDAAIASRLITEIRSRLSFLEDVGLGYLTLNRLSNSLSGGESQRINLATSLGSALVGSVYILDEPSIGLHSRDTDKLIKVLKQLRDIGNTVIVVEHDEEIMRAADYIIDIGPNAGRLGGEVVYEGDMTDLRKGTDSHTVRYLLGEETITPPTSYRPWNRYIEVKGARQNNLKNIDVKFPLNIMTVVTGVSGSGKSTLVRDILYRGLKRRFDEAGERPGEHTDLIGDIDAIEAIDFVDQDPIGKSSRSNPVTYIKAYDEIRKLMASQALSKQMGYTAAYFSFNTEGGRCEECKGDGTLKIEMQFMADLILPCESCNGKRFKDETLEVVFQGKNVYDILDMTVDAAIEFFTQHKQKRIAKLLQPLQDVGLGYVKLGQPSSTLSGGENQRVKLAYYLSREKTSPTLFIFDEPTTGLHFHDIKKLLAAFSALIERGHSIIIIEHNLDVIKCADHLIDLGPEGGSSGGNIVITGTPQEVAKSAKGHTARFLKDKL